MEITEEFFGHLIGRCSPAYLPISFDTSRGVYATGAARRDWEVHKDWEVPGSSVQKNLDTLGIL
jgi:hypothetical protein